MEELRDDRLGKIVTWMQSWVRGYLSRKEFKKLQEQRLALQVCQRNLRKYLKLRTWPWYKLWQKVRPLLNVTRIEDEIAVSSSHFTTQYFGNADIRFKPSLVRVIPGFLSLGINYFRISLFIRKCFMTFSN